ncbi:hypothetical protein CPC08DRAFT_707470 [Agrocybe pediades]|nr:hypothetical protein CPC08DRAFT_707470 [Agrocybe pediades]
MPRYTTEHSPSPERISHHLRPKVATAIDIPKRRRPAGDQNLSPDLLFEMSPVSKNSPIGTAPSSTNSSLDQPFMYRAPSFKPLPPKPLSGQSFHSTKNLCSDTSGAGSVFTGPKTARLPETPKTAVFPSLQPDLYGAKRTQPKTKITGFVPLFEHQPPASDEGSKPKRPPLPPPRRSPHSSPWILSGTSDPHGTCVGSYSLTDPSALEFHHHLLRRIDNRDSSRLKSLHTCF